MRIPCFPSTYRYDSDSQKRTRRAHYTGTRAAEEVNR